MSGPNKVEHTTRAVIEQSILLALENDKSKVAILCDKNDLNILIAALGLTERVIKGGEDFRLSLEQLRREAFGE